MCLACCRQPNFWFHTTSSHDKKNKKYRNPSTSILPTHVLFRSASLPSFSSTNVGSQVVPPELRWQSGRLLTDRSLVRSQVVAIPFVFFFYLGNEQVGRPAGSRTPRTHGATAVRRIPDPKVGGSNPSGFSSILQFFYFETSAYL